MIERFRGRALLADEQGLGKTIQALDFIAQHEQIATPGLIVCPAALKENWALEAYKHYGLECDIAEGQMSPLDPIPHKLLIINYDVLIHWQEYLSKIDWKTIIADECQRIKNHKAKSSRAFRRIANRTDSDNPRVIKNKRIPFALMLSGTPIENRPFEIWNPLSILNSKEWGTEFEFGSKYCEARWYRGEFQYKGADNLEELNYRLRKNCLIRRRKAEVLKDLPDKRRQILPCKLSDYPEYNHAAEDLVGWLLDQKKTAQAQRAARTESLVRIGYLLRLCAELKREIIYEMIDTHLETTDRKLVVFAWHRSVLEDLENRYKNSVSIHGKTPKRLRQANVDSFQKDDRVRLFFGQYKSAGAGITLTKASDSLMVEWWYVPGVLLQAEDRTHRIGQTNAALVTYLTAMDTVEEDLAGITQRKARQINAAIDGGKAEKFDVFDEFLKAIEKRHG